MIALDSETIDASPDLGFHFNQQENNRIRHACKNALIFMEAFGKGRMPYLIDLSHYNNNIADDNDSHFI